MIGEGLPRSRKVVSPNGKLRLHITECNGKIPQQNTWEDSREKFFRDGLIYPLKMYNEESIYPVPEMLEAYKDWFLDVVIHMLLGPQRVMGRKSSQLWFMGINGLKIQR